MDGDVGLEILIIFLLIIANGIFSMTELAIVNARKGLLEDSAEKGSTGAQRAIQLSEDPNQMFLPYKSVLLNRYRNRFVFRRRIIDAYGRSY